MQLSNITHQFMQFAVVCKQSKLRKFPIKSEEEHCYYGDELVRNLKF